MRGCTSAGFGLMVLAIAIVPASAQNGPGASLPDTTACPREVADIATCYSAKLETGAYLLIAMPKNWNGSLIVFAHGGPAVVRVAAMASHRTLTRPGGQFSSHPSRRFRSERSFQECGRRLRTPGGLMRLTPHRDPPKVAPGRPLCAPQAACRSSRRAGAGRIPPGRCGRRRRSSRQAGPGWVGS